MRLKSVYTILGKKTSGLGDKAKKLDRMPDRGLNLAAGCTMINNMLQKRWARGEDEAQMNSGRERIKALQALRAMAFLGIFFAHADFFVSWSSLGVSVFCVMSGFLMMYNYEGVGEPMPVRGRLRFSVNKIKKLYPLHIVTMVFAVLLTLALMLWHGDGMRAYARLAGETVLHVLLLQTWVPHASVSVSLNGVSWYLSAALFLYFVFPCVAPWIRRRSNKLLAVLCAAMLGAQIAACIPFLYLAGESSFVYIWFMYFFPVFRLGDFFVGCCLGKAYGDSAAGGKIAKGMGNGECSPGGAGCRLGSGGTGPGGRLSLGYSLAEIAATALTVVVCLWLKQGHSSGILLAAFRNWTTLYIPLAAAWVYLFAANRGIITVILNNKLLVSLGNISGYVFLIHYVVVLYVNNMLNFFDIEVSGWPRTGLAMLELAVSVIASLLYIRIEEAVRSRMRRKRAERGEACKEDIG